jgi:primosomal protein N' (replication factor Y)
MYAQIVPLGTPVDREMTYLVPEDLHQKILTGSRVLVPLGPRWTTGIVVGFQEETDLDKVRSVGILLDDEPVLSEDLLQLCRWIADYYVCTLSEVLKTALPAGMHTDSGQKFVLANQNGGSRITPTQQQVIDQLENGGSLSLRQLERRLGGSGTRSAVFGLVRTGKIATIQEMLEPRVKPKTEREVELLPDARWLNVELPKLEKRAPKQGQCIRELWGSGGKLRAADLSRMGINGGVVRALEHRKLVRLNDLEVRRDPYAHTVFEAPEEFEPSPHQKAALDAVVADLDAGRFQPHLLHGITGSGKTLVYILAVRHAMAANKGAIILVPEISLTPQTVRRFKSHFGDQVAVLHSALSDGERFDAWRDVREGLRNIVIGARSAIFAPVQNLGLIVVDEEHDSSYKQADPAPRYNARDIATVRAKMSAIPVILGSATPSLESFHNARTMKYQLLSLPERVDSRSLPQVTLVNMKEEGGGIFSTPLREKMKDRLEKSERIILLQNRRGYAPYVQCIDCGESLECPNCQVTYTYHAKGCRIICHYCADNLPSPNRCEACGGGHLQLFGVGTQRVEEALEDQFPTCRVLRMDVDTTRRKGAHDQILESFRKGEADILLGTQMVAKGLDFPEVTLVGVISADTSIHLPDFRASERTFQLLTQVSGRAGRGKSPGEVVVQTYVPDCEAVQCAREHDFLKFAETELEDRSSLEYPPFGRMALLLFKGKNENDVATTAGRCAEILRTEAPKGLEVMGPAQAPLARIRNSYRWQVILKSTSPRLLNEGARNARNQFGRRRSAVALDIDIDPVSML